MPQWKPSSVCHLLTGHTSIPSIFPPQKHIFFENSVPLNTYFIRTVMGSSEWRLQISATGLYQVWALRSSLLVAVSSLIYAEVYTSYTYSWESCSIVTGISKNPWWIRHGQVFWERFLFVKERRLTWQIGIQVKYEPGSILFLKLHISCCLPAFKGQTCKLKKVCECILVAKLFFCQLYEAITHDI